MRLELLSGDTIEVISVTVEIPMNPNVLTEEMRDRLNNSVKPIHKPDTNIAIKNKIATSDPTHIIGYITHINEKSVFAEIYDAHYLKNLYDLFIEPILINVSKDDLFVIFECYIDRDGDKLTKLEYSKNIMPKNSEVTMDDLNNHDNNSKETYNTISGVLTTPHAGRVHEAYGLSNDQLWVKAGTYKPITKQDVNIKSSASKNGLETLLEV